MKALRVVTLITVVSWTTAEARAQYGLYGSPEMVRLPPVQSNPPSYYQGGTLMRTASQEPAPIMPEAPVPVVNAVELFDNAAAPQEPQRAAPQEPQRAPSAVGQMLEEAGPAVPPPSKLKDPGYGQTTGTEGALWDNYGYEPCEVPEAECDLAAPCRQYNWYATAQGLIMGRNAANRVWTSYDSNNNARQLMHTDTGLDWRGGGEIRFGRKFCCGTWALEAGYWTLDAFTGFASVTNGGLGVSTPLQFHDVRYQNPAIVGTPEQLFSSAEEHRFWRRDELHSVEVALINYPLGFGISGPFELGWSVGPRFFRFEENLLFGSRRQGVPNWLSPDQQGYLEDDITNNLMGVQFGFDFTYRRGNWSLFALPKMGVYNNHIQNYFNAYRGDGELFQPDYAPERVGPVGAIPARYPAYPVNSTANVVSFLSQVDVGLEWQFAQQWSARIGYRVVFATGIGLADHQIPAYIVDTPEIAHIDANGDLVLHGGFAGLTFSF